MIGVILGKLYRLPLVITEHSSNFPRRLIGFWDLKMAMFSLNKCDMILPVSEWLEKAIKSYGVKNRFYILPNVVDISLFYPSPHKPTRRGKRKMLLVARLHPVKGVPYLLEALHILRKKRSDFLLDIVGDGPYREEYEQIVSRFELSDFVSFHGAKPKEEIAEFMREADFFVLPSLWENLPCVLIEAMASGLPIVATNVGGVPEIVKEERGILVPPQNPLALAEAMDYMLDNYVNYPPDELFAFARDNFSLEVIGRRLTEVYDEVLSKVRK
ncbi:MAG: glycosyltransferase [bacterium]